jgi:hypothetical protein
MDTTIKPKRRRSLHLLPVYALELVRSREELKRTQTGPAPDGDRDAVGLRTAKPLGLFGSTSAP